MSKVKNNIAFFGSSFFSAVVLEELEKAGILPSLIISVPPKPKGRGLLVEDNPVATFAKEKGIECVAPEKLDESFIKFLKERDIDVAIVASYGKIIPNVVLSSLPFGFLNIHPSLLPKYRGATPVSSQILNNDNEIGVSVMEIDEKMDHGPILKMKRVDVPNFPTRASVLEDILAREGARLVVEVLPPWLSNKISPVPQNDEWVSYTKKIKKEDGEIDLLRDAYKNYLKFLAYDNSVGVFFFAMKKGEQIRVKITEAEYESGSFTPTRVVPQGGKEMSYCDFLRGLA